MKNFITFGILAVLAIGFVASVYAGWLSGQKYTATRNSLSYCDRLDFDISNENSSLVKGNFLKEKEIAIIQGKCK